MEIYTYAQLKKMEEDYNKAEHHFWDVVYTEKNGLAPKDERFVRSDAYESITYCDFADAERVANIIAEKHPSPNARVVIKHWTILNEKITYREETIIKECAVSLKES